MDSIPHNFDKPDDKAEPLCPVFGECGGCAYQDMTYEAELAIKERDFQDIMSRRAGLGRDVIAPIVPSPRPYHYRNRLDLKLKRTKNGIFIGFTPSGKKGVVPVEACAIAEKAVSDFIPRLKNEALARLPLKYRVANLTVRCGDDGRVFWGGIGRRSCRLAEKDYLWTELQGRRIFYSLDTFFQGNTGILPALFQTMTGLPVWEPRPVLYDLYGGVGLFGIGLYDRVKGVKLIEENIQSLQMARYNAGYNSLEHFEVVNGCVEEILPEMLNRERASPVVGIIDPPRAGLSPQATKLLTAVQRFRCLMYLSCNPDSLARDLTAFLGAGWNVEKVIPFDFFPKTRHLEALAVLRPFQERTDF